MLSSTSKSLQKQSFFLLYPKGGSCFCKVYFLCFGDGSLNCEYFQFCSGLEGALFCSGAQQNSRASEADKCLRAVVWTLYLKTAPCIPLFASGLKKKKKKGTTKKTSPKPPVAVVRPHFLPLSRALKDTLQKAK